ncbi:MAG TPA: CoA transferase, partial [Brevibacterium sp.]|nr:CoA transferase [Brevibacterium sp.]
VEPMPNRIPAWAVYDIFRTAGDDQIFVAAVSDTQFRSLCSAFGLEDLASDISLTTNAGRVAARETIHTSLQRRLDELPLEEVERICDGADLPYARVNTPSDLVDDPHLMQTGGLVETQTPGTGSALVPLLPLLIDGQRLQKRSEVPQPGEHDAEVLGTLTTRTT